MVVLELPQVVRPNVVVSVVVAVAVAVVIVVVAVVKLAYVVFPQRQNP